MIYALITYAVVGLVGVVVYVKAAYALAGIVGAILGLVLAPVGFLVIPVWSLIARHDWLTISLLWDGGLLFALLNAVNPAMWRSRGLGGSPE